MQLVSLTNFFKTRKPYALAIFVIIVVLAGGGLFYLVNHKAKNGLFASDKNIVFSIDSKNYYKSNVQKLIAYPKSQHVSQNTAAREAFDALKEIKAAQNLGYAPSSGQVNTQKTQIYAIVKPSSAQQTLYSDWFTLLATKSAIDESVNSLNTVGYAGYSYVFYFGQHLESSPDYIPSGLNNPGLVAQDKAYARQQANYYHQQVQDNKMSLADALTKSGAAMQSRGNNVGNPNFSASFTTEENLKTTVIMPDIVQYITSTDKTGLSDVKIGKAANAPIKSGGKNVNMYYYFVDLTTVPITKTISAQQFNQELTKLLAQYRGFSS
jgi:hypothetical protein